MESRERNLGVFVDQDVDGVVGRLDRDGIAAGGPLAVSADTRIYPP